MENIDEKERITTLTLRVRQEDKEMFEEIRHTLGDPVHAEVFNNIVTRYNMPMRANEEAARRAEELKNELDQSAERIAQLTEQLAEAERRADENAAKAEHEREAFEAERARLEPGERQRLVDFLPHCLKAVEAVAAREGRRRGQAWTISHVINFFIQSRFIEGQLNGDLAALTDGECRRLGIEPKASRRKEIEI